jgi:hypothetical protein
MAGLVDRVKNILLSPKTEWPVIDGESGDTKEVFTYVAILAALPLVGTVLGGLIGTGPLGLVGSVTIAIIGYVVAFLGVYVMAFIVDALAGTFNGEKHMPSALKLVAYGYTPVWVAGILGFIPVLGGLVVLVGAIYSIYLLYLGLPVMMRAPQDKVIGYLIVAIICAIVVWAVLFFIIGLVTAPLLIATGRY